MLAAGLDGVARGLTLPPPLQDDPATLGDDGLARLGIERLPQQLTDAADALDESAVLRAAMGEELHAVLVAVRRAEAAADAGKPVERLVAEQRWRFCRSSTSLVVVPQAQLLATPTRAGTRTARQAAASPAGSASAASGSSRILRSGERTSQSTASVPPAAAIHSVSRVPMAVASAPAARDPSGRTP